MAGATKYVPAANFKTPAVLGAINGTPRLDAIRSFTVGNRTSATTVNVYIGQTVGPQFVFQVPPGSNVTMPIEETQWVTFSFSTNSVFDGFCYLHVDSDALAASGFQFPLTTSPVLAPNGYSPLLGGGTLEWMAEPMFFDGSATTTFIFPLAFTAQVFQFVHAIDTGIADDGFQLSARFFGLSLSQVTCVVTGGAPGSHGTVRIFVVGV